MSPTENQNVGGRSFTKMFPDFANYFAMPAHNFRDYESPLKRDFHRIRLACLMPIYNISSFMCSLKLKIETSAL